MKHLQLALFLLNFSYLSAQTTQSEHRPYSNYAQSWFECDFPSKDPTINDYCKNQPDGTDRNFLTAHFSADSTYEIGLSLLEKQGAGVVRNDYFFKGRYALLENGQLVLDGKHPFKANILKIKEKKRKKCGQIYGFTFQLNETYSWTNDSRLKTYCDGACGEDYDE